jgi:hypothetical protein
MRSKFAVQEVRGSRSGSEFAAGSEFEVCSKNGFERRNQLGTANPERRTTI